MSSLEHCTFFAVASRDNRFLNFQLNINFSNSTSVLPLVGTYRNSQELRRLLGWRMGVLHTSDVSKEHLFFFFSLSHTAHFLVSIKISITISLLCPSTTPFLIYHLHTTRTRALLVIPWPGKTRTPSHKSVFPFYCFPPVASGTSGDLNQLPFFEGLTSTKPWSCICQPQSFKFRPSA